MRLLVTLLLAVCLPLRAQEKLSLHAAVELALKQNKSLQASQISVLQAETQVKRVRAAQLPKVDYVEALTRSDNPVFVFGSLLTQHQFTQSNFELGSLNRPPFLDNFQSNLTVSETVFDAGKTRNQIRSALASKQISEQDDRQARMQTIFEVAKAYLDAALSRESVKAAEKAIQSAEADLAKAEEVRRVGMSTDADVLSIKVQVARVKELKIKREADGIVALATLNEAMGLPLDETHELTTTFKRAELLPSQVNELELTAVLQRPEKIKTTLAGQAASARLAGAKAAMLPTVSLHGTFEADRQDFLTRGGANWTANVSLSWNVFNGRADKARSDEASETLAKARLEQDRVTSTVRLDVRRAYEGLRAAEQQIAVSESTVAEAEESLRIVRNRYEAGLSTVTDLLQTESAVEESRALYLAALHERRLAAVVLEAASGTLSADSAVLQD